MPTYTSKHERDADFHKLDMLILSLERHADSKELTLDMLRKYHEAFDKYNSKYIDDPSFRAKDRGLFKPLEFRALIFLAQGDENLADSALREAANLKHSDENWVSVTAKKWEAANATDLADIETEDTLHYNGNLEGWLALYSLSFFITPLILLYDLFGSLPGLKNQLNSSSYNVASDFQTLINFAIFFDVVSQYCWACWHSSFFRNYAALGQSL